jgi:hypothetical protein
MTVATLTHKKGRRQAALAFRNREPGAGGGSAAPAKHCAMPSPAIFMSGFMPFLIKALEVKQHANYSMTFLI